MRYNYFPDDVKKIIDIAETNDRLVEVLKDLHKVITVASKRPAWESTRTFFLREDILFELYYYTTSLGKRKSFSRLTESLKAFSGENQKLFSDLQVEDSDFIDIFTTWMNDVFCDNLEMIIREWSYQKSRLSEEADGTLTPSWTSLNLFSEMKETLDGLWGIDKEDSDDALYFENVGDSDDNADFEDYDYDDRMD